MKLVNEIWIIVKWMIPPIKRLCFSPLNDDLCVIVEPIFDCVVKVSQASFIVVDLLFEISDSQNSHPGNDGSLLGKYPVGHETPYSV